MVSLLTFHAINDHGFRFWLDPPVSTKFAYIFICSKEEVFKTWWAVEMLKTVVFNDSNMKPLPKDVPALNTKEDWWCLPKSTTEYDETSLIWKTPFSANLRSLHRELCPFKKQAMRPFCCVHVGMSPKCGYPKKSIVVEKILVPMVLLVDRLT